MVSYPLSNYFFYFIFWELNHFNVGLRNTERISKVEDDLIQHEIKMWIPEMSTVLENIPKQMILILKTNDLLRGLETTLNCRPDASCFITMSQ